MKTTLTILRQWSDAGWLRRLDSALAALVAELDPQAAPEVLVATALLAHMEGRGHTCLALAPQLRDPGALLGWPPDAQAALQDFWHTLPDGLQTWVAAQQGCRPMQASPWCWAAALMHRCFTCAATGSTKPGWPRPCGRAPPHPCRWTKRWRASGSIVSLPLMHWYPIAVWTGRKSPVR